MKATRLLIAWIMVLAAIGGVLWGSFVLKAKLSPESAEAAEGEEKAPEGHAMAEKLGLVTQALAAATWTPQIEAQARVIDPGPLVALVNEISSTEGALKATEAELQRARQLFQTGENIARKTLEQAEAQALTERLRVQALRQRLNLEWGSVFAKDGEAMSAALASGQMVLVRAELSSVAALTQEPQNGRVVLPGKQPLVIPAARLLPAPTVDARTQSRAYFLCIDKPPVPLPPGLSMSATLTLPGTPLQGVLIPHEAVLYYQGAAWVFLAQDGEQMFARRVVQVERPLPGGFFVNEAFKTGERVVTTGAASLLADELKAHLEAD